MQDAALSPDRRKNLLLLEQEPKYVEIPVSPGRRREDSPRGVTVTLTGVTLGKKEDRARKGAQEPDASGDHPSTGGKGHRADEVSEGTSSRCSGSEPPSPVNTPRQCTANNDEAHYITTHEIQLCEADQEPDYPGFGLAPSTWSEPADSAPCAFLEYASFDSQGGSPTDEDCSYYLSTTSERNPTDSLGSTELVSTYSDSEPPSSSSSSTASGRSTPRDRAAGLPAGGQILLSIKTASKAINEASETRAAQHSAPDARHETDMSFCVSRATDSKSAFKQHHCYPHTKPGDAHRMVAIPARLQARSGVHADISSGASSVVSELDDADKEVRSLTSRAFRSLAYPYFEAINFSSSESTTSLSDQNLGINSWSTYLDWKGSAFLSQKAEQSLQHKRTTATSKFGLQKLDRDAATKEQVYLQANKSHQTKAFELVVSELAPKGTDQDATSSKKVQAGSRIVTLTETLNFSSNVKTTTASAAAAASALGSNRACKPNEQAPVSACTDGGVAELMLRDSSAAQEGSKPASSASEAMEGTHKSKFASSLLKNVISKKMQLEQEFKMERGEITDTSQKNQNSSSKDSEASKDKGVQRQSSRFSEAGSDLTLLSSTEDLADFFDSKALNPKDFAPAAAAESHPTKHPDTQNQDSTSEGKPGTTDTMKGNLLRSQNSAFRSWKEKEIEKMEKKIEEKVAKARRIKIPLERDWRAELGELSDNTCTKMSRLFVPGPQNNPKEKPAEKQATKHSVSTYAHQSCYSRNEVDFKTEKLHILKASASRMTPAITPKPQEIKLNLGLAGVTKDSPFNIAKLLTPNLASSVTSLSKASEELRNQLPSRSEVLEKMPQFLVRDVRETKPKVQGPIHQVRDVRKLLKSSYNHDNGDSDRGSVMSDQSSTDPKSKLSAASKGSNSLSPIVITCQAVKSKEEGGTNDDQKNLSSAETILVHRASGRLPVATIAPNKTGPRMPVVKIVSKASKWKQEKPKEVEVKPEPKSPQSQAALEKLTAAVKTMEQLYVYDRREWKRKSDPQPLSGSHVLSLIANHEAAKDGKAEEPRKAPVPPVYKAPLERRNSNPGAEKTTAKSPATENKTPLRSFQVSRFTEGKSQEQEKSRPKAGAGGAGARSVFTVSAAPVKTKQQSLESAMNSRNTRPQPPNSLKISQEETKKTLPTPPQLPSPARKASADIENYLTIPVKVPADDASGKPPLASAIREPPASSRDLATNPRESSGMCSLPPCSAKTQAPSPKSPIRAPSDWRHKGSKEPQPHRASSTGSEPLSPDSVPPATIYHHTMPSLPMAMSSVPAPIFYSPPMSAATPADLYPQQTQRKMLVDLATGQYYLVDTPVQPVKKRLYDPETGQYVEVPVPPPPATPVPLHMPPLTLSPGAYGAAYMFYPGFMPTTVLPANPLQTQLSNQSTEHTYEMPVMEGAQNPEMNMPEGPYYLATGSAPVCATTGQPGNIRRGSFGCPDGKQMISIMSPPGPRIVAPPSFDGTTMRFVVEHR